jgi:hypothetical protein
MRLKEIFVFGAIALLAFSRNDLPLNLVAVTFLIYVWIYSNSTSSSNSHLEPIKIEPITEKQLKACFPAVIYHLQSLEYHPQEIYCRGNLRSQNSQYAYETINQNIQKIFGDRFICYLQESPLENSEAANIIDSQETKTNYCFYLRPKHNLSNTQTSDRLIWMASLISIPCTLVSVLAVGGNTHKFINQFTDFSLLNLQQGIPYGLCLATIFMVRAIAQFYVISKYKLRHRRRFIFPLFLPVLGGFGCLGSLNHHLLVTPSNHTNQRRILFDLATIPSIAGIASSIILLVLGNWLMIPEPITIGEPLLPTSLLTSLNTFDFKNSILINSLQAIFAISRSEIAPIRAFSPLTLAGWAGLSLSAMQLMPFKLLDGGNIVIAMFGHRQTVQIARITRLVLLAIAVLAQPWLRIYSLLLFLLPTPDPLILNEHIEISKNRDLIGIILLAIALLIILPVPKFLF